MIKRTIEISEPETYISSRYQQIIIHRNNRIVAQIPAEDIGVCIIATPMVTFSQNALTNIAEQGGVVVLCGKNFQPSAMILPLVANSLQTLRMHHQVQAKRPLKKQLWAQLVRAKVLNQSAITEDPATQNKLKALAERIRSGDPDNIESQAARIYWRVFLGSKFRFKRERFGDPPNNLLNYGYMALRAAVARSICGAGLHPSFPIHHKNRFDAFCLADDLMEPFRPIVDLCVRSLFRNCISKLTPESKRRLLELLTFSCELKGQTGPLLVMLERMTASLVHCYEGETKSLAIPRPLFEQYQGGI
ncbi:type II CRISPR-associated endonuclease Cas1 [Candidatus Sumerlaeota bacterium]|nr:type II CRISPR-associated endonuclease Cas1 [Candidatus Sumerlaeota bacterium]